MPVMLQCVQFASLSLKSIIVMNSVIAHTAFAVYDRAFEHLIDSIRENVNYFLLYH